VRVRANLIPLSIALALALPAGASAAPTGSIVFAKGGNLYRARADGSGGRRLTRDGSRSHPYKHPTQADDGTVVKARGCRASPRSGSDGTRTRDLRRDRAFPGGRGIDALEPFSGDDRARFRLDLGRVGT
jgi:hypothetical protein